MIFKRVNLIWLNSLRGMLCSLYNPLYNMGVIIAFILGIYLNCIDQVIAQLILPIVFIFVLFLIPEAPDFLNKRTNYTVVHSIRYLFSIS